MVLKLGKGHYISSSSVEFKTAYKLYAYCRENDISEFSTQVLLPIFTRNNSNLHEWWNGNAKYVLPFVDSDINFIHTHRFKLPREWEALVESAAKTWTLIASTWAVIRIPNWMDRESQEYATYEKYRNAIIENIERNEYQRLKEKFEGEGR